MNKAVKKVPRRGHRLIKKEERTSIPHPRGVDPSGVPSLTISTVAINRRRLRRESMELYILIHQSISNIQLAFLLQAVEDQRLIPVGI